jgi:transcriptional regulator with XRE-family HTH domain
VLAPAELVGRVAASLRAVRRARALSQHDLAGLAGVTASAISQAERAGGWRNPGQAEAVLFWIVTPATASSRGLG